MFPSSGWCYVLTKRVTRSPHLTSKWWQLDWGCQSVREGVPQETDRRRRPDLSVCVSALEKDRRKDAVWTAAAKLLPRPSLQED